MKYYIQKKYNKNQNIKISLINFNNNNKLKCF